MTSRLPTWLMLAQSSVTTSCKRPNTLLASSLILSPLHHLRSPSPFRRFATHTESGAGPGPSSSASSSSSSSRASATFQSDLLDRLEAEARQKASAALGERDRVGPFPLGVGPSGRSRTWKRWSELGIAGKVVRTTTQTGNLTVILIGGSLFVLLAFALTTELFATNSPSVMYSHCVDMIRDSNALDLHLLPPLSFTHTPHSASPTRGSPPVVHTFARHPTSGRDHLLLTFWVHGRGKDEPERLFGFADWVKIRSTISNWFENGVTALGLGVTIPEDELKENGADQRVENKNEQIDEMMNNTNQGWLNRLVGSFSALRLGYTTANKTTSSRGLPPPGTYTVGEVRADYVKNASGQFTLLSLVVDIPSSRVAYPNRAVVFWSPEADSEGLIPRRR